MLNENISKKRRKTGIRSEIGNLEVRFVNRNYGQMSYTLYQTLNLP